MTTRNLSVRLALEGGQRVRRELRDVGTTGQRALARVQEATEPASRGLQLVDGAASERRARFDQLTRQLGPLGAGLRALGPCGVAVGAAVADIGLLVRSTVRQVQTDGRRRCHRGGGRDLSGGRHPHPPPRS